jgi:phosphoenolpyruvate-protein kinase (PTS system EI component)
MHEKIYRGIVASPGIVIGRAYLLDRRKIVVAGQRIEDVSVKTKWPGLAGGGAFKNPA